MIHLTPLDVRKKQGDFRKILRGYDPEEVDTFLDLVAERMEVLVKEHLTLTERAERLWEQVEAQEGRETAVREALVTAQELRADMRKQSSKEAELLLREAESEAEHTKREAGGEVERIVTEAEQLVRERLAALEELERQRQKFLRAFRTLLERELDAVVVEEGRNPLGDVTLEIDLSGGRRGGKVDASEPSAEEPIPDPDPDPDPDPEADPPEAEVEPAEEPPEEASAEVGVEEDVAEEVIVEAEDRDFEEMEDPEVVIEKPKTKQGTGEEPLWLSSLLDHQSQKDEE